MSIAAENLPLQHYTPKLTRLCRCRFACGLQESVAPAAIIFKKCFEFRCYDGIESKLVLLIHKIIQSQSVIFADTEILYKFMQVCNVVRKNTATAAAPRLEPVGPKICGFDLSNILQTRTRLIKLFGPELEPYS